MRRIKKYAMVKLAAPKRVTLLNGRTFVASYKRIKRSEVPPHIVMRRTYTQRAAPRGRRRRVRAYQGQGIFDFVKKVAKNPLVRSIAKKGLKYAPGVYHNLTKRVKNKTLKRVLNSDAAHLALNKAIKQQIIAWLRDKGIANIQINNFDEENQDIKNNYMGVYSMDSIKKYINFYEII